MKNSHLYKAILLMAVSGLLLLGSANAASQRKIKPSKTVEFDDLLVKGKYHFSDEAVVTVEEDKVLDALLGIRKDFKDRMQRSAERH